MGGVLPRTFELAEKVQSFAAGRGISRVVEVHQEQIELPLLQGLGRTGCGRGHGFRGVSVALQEQAERFQDVGLVIGNQDSPLDCLGYRLCFRPS